MRRNRRKGINFLLEILLYFLLGAAVAIALLGVGIWISEEMHHSAYSILE